MCGKAPLFFKAKPLGQREGITKSVKRELAEQILAAAGKRLLVYLIPNKKNKRGTRSKEAVERKKMKFLA